MSPAAIVMVWRGVEAAQMTAYACLHAIVIACAAGGTDIVEMHQPSPLAASQQLSWA
jgi:hypothetical protein